MPIVKKTLEKILGEERFESLKNYEIGRVKLYDVGVDAFSLNSFSYYVAFIYEKIIAGFSWKKHLFTRGVALFTNTSSARAYEKIRTKVFEKLNIDDTTPIKRYIADTFLFIGLQMPLHWANMSIATLLEKGTIELEDLQKMALASLPMIPIAGFLGGPYGRYRDRIRKSCGLPIEYAKKQRTNILNNNNS